MVKTQCIGDGHHGHPSNANPSKVSINHPYENRLMTIHSLLWEHTSCFDHGTSHISNLNPLQFLGLSMIINSGHLQPTDPQSTERLALRGEDFEPPRSGGVVLENQVWLW